MAIPQDSSPNERRVPFSQPVIRTRANLASSPAPAEAAEEATGPSSHSTGSLQQQQRLPPYVPTWRESCLFAVFPALLLFGTVFSVLSPQTRDASGWSAGSSGSSGSSNSPLSAAHFSQAPQAAPSYFARKNNMFNVLFVKRGWLWISLAFAAFVATHPTFYNDQSAGGGGSGARDRRHRRRRVSATVAACLRWALVTLWWLLVTQWCFGPPLIDRSFRLTGGGCQAVVAAVAAAAEEQSRDGPATDALLFSNLATAAACKSSGGRWRGGHDISGHVFLLVLGTTFLAQEVGWALLRSGGGGAGASASAGSAFWRTASEWLGSNTARTIVMDDGAVKTAEVEAQVPLPSSGNASATSAPNEHAEYAVRFVGVVLALSLWMLLMTAIYFHTWREKLSGLLVAMAGLYGVYVVPRFVPAIRRVVGIPGV